MFYKNLIVTFRTIARNKSFSLINLAGLSIGLAASFFLLLYILHETGYNKCHKNHNNIYRVIETKKKLNITQPYAPYYFSKYLQKDFPEVKSAVRMGYIYSVAFKKSDEFIPEPGVFAADPALFDIFTLPVISGNSNDFLKDPSSIVITKRIAEKYFSGGNALGKKMEMKLNNQTYLFRVDGVIKDIPRKSTLIGNIFCHIDFEWERSKQYYPDENFKYSWNNSAYQTYVLLSNGSSVSQLEKKMSEFVKKYMGKNNTTQYTFQSLDDVYFHSRHLMNTFKWGDLHKIYTFMLIALLILFIAITNYVILSTAQSVTRFKEIGVRKTVGATKKSLLIQIFSESVVLSLLAVPLAILIMYFSISFVNNLLNTRFVISSLLNLKMVFGIITIAIIAGVLSGIYLSLFLSKVNPVEALKSTNPVSSSKSWFRFILITFQIIVFVVLIVFMQIISAQIRFAETVNIGYDVTNLVTIRIDDEEAESHYHEIFNELKKNPDIVNASAASYIPPYPGWQKVSIPHAVLKNKYVSVEQLDVDYDFVETMGLKIIQGRSFSRQYGSDSVDAAIISKSVIDALGLPENPVGKILKKSEKSGYRIIGVMDDLYMRSIKENKGPLMLTLSNKYLDEIAVRYKPGTDSSSIAYIKKIFNDFFPNNQTDYTLGSQAIKQLYNKEVELKHTITAFSLLVIIISMLGLYALALFLIKQKSKTIGIRKVFGASTEDIIKSVTKEFLIVVLVANIIALPISIYLSVKWLSGYTCHINIGIQYFIIALLASIVLVMMTIVISSFKIANINPSESINYQN